MLGRDHRAACERATDESRIGGEGDRPAARCVRRSSWPAWSSLHAPPPRSTPMTSRITVTTRSLRGPTATKLFLDGKPRALVDHLAKLALLERLRTTGGHRSGRVFPRGAGWELDQRAGDTH
jgi:hypothetical protein